MDISSQGRLWPASEDDSSLVAAVQLLLQLTRRRQTKLDARGVRTARKTAPHFHDLWVVMDGDG